MKFFKINILTILTICLFSRIVFGIDQAKARPISSSEVIIKLNDLNKQINDLENDVKKINKIIINALYSQVNDHKDVAQNYYNKKKYALSLSEINNALTLLEEVKTWLNKEKSTDDNSNSLKIKELERKYLKSQVEIEYNKIADEVDKIFSIEKNNSNSPPQVDQLSNRIKKHLRLIKNLIFERKKYKLAMEEIIIIKELIKKLRNILQENQDNLSYDKDEEKVKNGFDKLDALIKEVREKARDTENKDVFLLLKDGENFRKTAGDFYQKKQYPKSIENVYTATRFLLRALDRIENIQKISQNEDMEENKALHKYEKFKNLFNEAKRVALNNPDKKIDTWLKEIENKKNKTEILLQNKKYKIAQDVLQESINLCISIITYEK